MECAMDLPASCGQDGTCDGAGACRKYEVGTQCGPGSCMSGMEVPASTCDATGACRPGTPRTCPGVCNGSTCGGACTGDPSCPTGAFCDVDTCRGKRINGSACTRAAQCESNRCVDNTCCASACTELCAACNNPSALGTCTPIAAGQDPGNECTLEAGNVCGYDGTCNGAGACRRPNGTSCGMSSCSNGIETPAPSCNGVGTCSSPVPRDCGAYVCAGNRCGTSCSSDAGCSVGHTCTGTTCVPLPGPVLYWKLDETSGGTAFDATSNGHHGTYTGNGAAMPTTSTVLPPAITFPNAASRFFDRDARHAIRLSDVPPALKPAADITVAVWYKAIDTDTSGESEIISMGNAYNLRIFNDQLEVAKHITNAHRQCRGPANPIDGNWHHLAGVITASELRLYHDGVLLNACAISGTIAYFATTVDLWVARHGGNMTDVRDFEGHLDDLRIYNRVLSAAEIARLASGKP